MACAYYRMLGMLHAGHCKIFEHVSVPLCTYTVACIGFDDSSELVLLDGADGKLATPTSGQH